MRPSSIRQFESGQALFREGEPGEIAYYIESGAVRVDRIVDGLPQPICRLGAGEIVGEMALIDGGIRTATVIATEPTRVLAIDSKTFSHRLAQADPLLALVMKVVLDRHRSGLGGGGTSCIDRHHPAVQAIRLENELRHALTEGGLHLQYQPIVFLGEGRVASFEALVRWTKPDGSAVPPAEFIPVAEDVGLIAELDEWVLEEACRQLAGWGSCVRIHVNLSATQFEDDLIPRIEDRLHRYGIDPSCLDVEITESALIGNERRARAVLKALRAMGVQISLDDFGTGFSSLSYLHRFPIDTLKIDRSFIQRLHGPESSRAIVKAILQMAETLGMTTIAEGIENAAQVETLRELGCRKGQGFFFSRPLHAVTAREFHARPALASVVPMPTRAANS